MELTDDATGAPVGEPTRYVLADAVRLLEVETQTIYTYDPAGNLVSVEDALGNETEYGYDERHRVIQTTLADSSVSYYSYNAASQVIASVAPDLRVETYEYDDAGRSTATYVGAIIDDSNPDSARYDEPTGSWSPGTDGFLGATHTSTSAAATAEWTFDGLIPGEEYEVYATWTDDDGNVDSVTYMIESGDLTIVDDDIDQTQAPGEDEGTSTAPIAFSDQAFQLIGSSFTAMEPTLTVTLSIDGNTANDTVVADAVYLLRKAPFSEAVYDAASRVVATIDVAGQRMDNAYDQLGRLVEVAHPDPDGDGPLGRPRTQYVYDAAGQVIDTIEYPGQSLDYDQRGYDCPRVVGDAMDIGAHEGTWSAETPTFEVSTTDDELDGDYEDDEDEGDDLSLREAVYLASLESDHVVITFDPNVFTTATTLYLDSELVIGSNVTIQGLDGVEITLDGQDSCRVFYVEDNVAAEIADLILAHGYDWAGGGVYGDPGSSLALRRVTITDCVAGDGGAVYSDYGDAVSLIDCTLQGNAAEYWGGAVATTAERLYIDGTVIDSNKAGTRGAGVYALYETLEIVDSLISNNLFSSDGANYGAGLYIVNGADTTIVRTTIEDNYIESPGQNGYNATRGGAIFMAHADSRLVIEDSVIRGNGATDYGGGLCVLGGDVQISGTVFEANVTTNVASYGGGVYVSGSSSTLSIRQSLFDANQTDGLGYGGGIAAMAGATVDLVGVTITSPAGQTGYGGGIFAYGDDVVVNLTHCTVAGNAAYEGGGIHSVGASVTLHNTIVADNTATSAGPDLYGTFEPDSSYNVIESLSGSSGINVNLGNQVDDPELGELLYNGGPTKTYLPDAGSPAIDHGFDPWADDEYYDGRGAEFLRLVGQHVDVGAVETGTGVFVVTTTDDDVDPEDGVLSLREAIAAAAARPGPDIIQFSPELFDFAPGAPATEISLNDTAIMIFDSDLKILGPGADRLVIDAHGDSGVFTTGSALFSNAYSTVVLSGMTLTSGHLTTGSGGAIFAILTNLTLNGVRVVDSDAPSGGAIYCTGGTLTLIDSEISDNRTSPSGGVNGGGVYLSNTDAEFVQTTFSHNEAAASGGAIYGTGTLGTLRLVACTVTNNTAADDGGGIYHTGAVELRNTIVAENSATEQYDDIKATVLPTSYYNLIGDGTGLTGMSDGEFGNQIGTSGSPIDPDLGPLDFYGGPTRTHAPYTDSPAVDAGSVEFATTPSRQITHFVYDGLGRLISETQRVGFDDSISSETDDVTTGYAYDAVGNLRTVTDPLGHETNYEYDHLYRLVSETDALDNSTIYDYDAAGQMTSLTDPEGNETSWTYDPHGRVAAETITVNSIDLTRSYEYDARGNLVLAVSRNTTDNTIRYEYDSLGRVVREAWYEDDEDTTADWMIEYDYNPVGLLAGVAEGDDADEDGLLDPGEIVAQDAYTYDSFRGLASTTQNLSVLDHDVRFDYVYNELGRLASVAASLDGGTTDDYVNDYLYNNVGRVTRITQSGVSGGNAVAEKRVDYVYEQLGQATGVTRWADLDGTELVAHTERAFDELGRLIQIVHKKTGATLAYYGYQWNKAGQITHIAFDRKMWGSEDVDYTYDTAGQLVDADYSYSCDLDDESYDYDDNGNREYANQETYATGDANRLESDGTYRYEYDGEGNRILKFTDVDEDGTFSDGDTDVTEYIWDHRNRLVAVTDYCDYFEYFMGGRDQTVEYVYDPFNQLVGRTVTVAGTLDVTEAFVHNVGQIVLHYQSDSAGPLGEADLAHRYLWGPGTDELLADEGPGVDETPGTADDTSWALTDHQGTVRDVVAYDAVADAYIVIAHMDYDSYGNLVGVPPTAAGMFLYTARLFDAATCLQNNLNRWYEATTGRWLSVDPIGFAAGDANLYRYVRNAPTFATDPSAYSPESTNVYGYVQDVRVRQLDPSGQERAERSRQGGPIPFAPSIKVNSISWSSYFKDDGVGVVEATFACQFMLPDTVKEDMDGWVVQEIQSRVTVYTCDGKKIVDDSAHFWEAWSLDSIRLHKIVGRDDTFDIAYSDAFCTYGTYAVKGLVKGAANWDLPSYFRAGAVPEAFELLATYTKPVNWDAIPGTPHEMVVEWRRCDVGRHVIYNVHTKPSSTINVAGEIIPV